MFFIILKSYWTALQPVWAMSDSVWCNYMQNFIGLLCSRCGHCQVLCGATTCKILFDCSVAGVCTVSECVVQLHAKLNWTALQLVCALFEIVWCNCNQNFLDCSEDGVGTVRECVVQLQANFYWTALQPVWALSGTVWCNYMQKFYWTALQPVWALLENVWCNCRQNFIGLLCSRCGHCQLQFGVTTCKILLDCSVASMGTVMYCVVQPHAKLYWTARSPSGHCQRVCGATSCKTLLDCSVAGVGTVRKCVVQLHAKFYWTVL